MIISSLIALALAIYNPHSIVLKSAIDVAKIIGLPRLKTMDKVFATIIFTNEVEQEFVYKPYSRLSFIKQYIKLDNSNL